MVKITLYLMIVPLVGWSVDSVNINALFKKGDVNYYKARIFYMIFVIIISYLVVSFLYDFIGVIS